MFYGDKSAHKYLPIVYHVILLTKEYLSSIKFLFIFQVPSLVQQNSSDELTLSKAAEEVFIIFL